MCLDRGTSKASALMKGRVISRFQTQQSSLAEGHALHMKEPRGSLDFVQSRMQTVVSTYEGWTLVL